jgi:predicted transcriptional regulator
MLTDVFKFFGLDEKSFEIYKTILSMRDVSASTIAKRINMPRSTVQFRCQEMTKKGVLCFYEKNNTFYYSPEHPNKLLRMIEDQQSSLEKINEKFKKIYPDLYSQFFQYGTQSKIKIFDGLEGIKNMFKDVLDSKSTIYGLTRNEGNLNKDILDWLENYYIPIRIKLKNSAYVIFNENETTKFYVTRDKILNRVSLFVPEKDFPFSSCCHIYDGKVAFYSYVKDDMTGILIENPNMFRSMLSLFKLSWLGARTLPVNEKYKDVDLPC